MQNVYLSLAKRQNAHGRRLTARRRWTADLPVGQVAIPCGGTHVRDIGELSTTTVTYEPIEGGFRAHTHVPPPAAAGE